MKIMHSLLLTALATLAPTALAQSAHAGHGRHAPAAHSAGTAAGTDDAALEAAFKRLDRDGDGFVTRQELPADHALLPHFGMSDADHDGRLDLGEFKHGMSML
ncbi:EF-hand domain-containing protein [Stenotrophomonas mori]|uniref:EF-hand domain-containing protein n=1 Tax=Stenotrophomonas mori TaxID=2871096 RepID=A0ABT0SJF3_9GAMM|nr:EF-hand domain-containing protein [Stenotrophomonas mori]MCL7715228.1 EF-hand domain-containing protein [Stenotrophomonas mori]